MLSILDLNKPTVQKRKHIVKQGTSNNLTCTADGHPLVNYKWFKNNRLVGTSSVYILKNITTADEGFYKCEVTNAVGSEPVYAEVVVECK